MTAKLPEWDYHHCCHRANSYSNNCAIKYTNNDTNIQANCRGITSLHFQTQFQPQVLQMIEKQSTPKLNNFSHQLNRTYQQNHFMNLYSIHAVSRLFIQFSLIIYCNKLYNPCTQLISEQYKSQTVISTQLVQKKTTKNQPSI